MKKSFLIILAGSLFVCACGGGGKSTTTPPAIAVSVTPGAQANIDQGQTLNFTAAVSNDSSGKGVSWTVSGTSCTGNGCGTFTNNSTTGVTYNAPTSGTANVSVTITATSVADTSKSKSTPVMVSPEPTINTTTLSGGTAGTAYSATLQSSGGAGSLTWSLASGSLPAGLSLSGAGAISGTPTSAGTATFTVKVTDASTAKEGTCSQTQQLTITIAPGPLTIATTSLPNASVGQAYSEPLQASGGTPPYTWTVASGSTLPGWLTLGGSGTSWSLSGTPSDTGSASFSLTVTDSSTPTAQSKTQALSVTVVTPSAACGTGNESILKGQYAFTLRGWNSLNGFLAAIGSFTADGNGNITAGMVDSNGALGVQSGAITASGSSYSVGSDNRGCATIVTPFYTFTTRFALQTPPSGVSTGGALEEWESGTSPYIAVGKLLLQKSIPAKLPAGSWVFQQTGIYSTSIYRTGVVGVIKADGNGNFTDGEYDSNVLGFYKTYTGLTGTYTNADATTGRFTEATTLKGVTVHRVDYLVSSTKFLELVSDALAGTSTVLIGEGEPQSGSLTVSGKLVYYDSGLYGTGNSAEFGLVTVGASNTLTVNDYTDYSGTWTPSTVTCSYSIDSYGKMLINNSGCLVYYIAVYLAGPNAGVLMAYDNGVRNGALVAQTATTLTSGNYFFSTALESVNYDETTQVGVVAVNTAGATGTSDMTSVGSPEQADQAVAETLTVNPDGTFSSSDNAGVIAGIIISNSQVVFVGDQKHLYPTVLVVSTTP